MPQTKDDITTNRLEKLLILAARGSQSDLRREFEDFQETYRGTRQAMEHRLNRIGDLASRPVMSNGRPMGTMGYKLLCTLRFTEPDRSKWVGLVLNQLNESRRTASVLQFLEWLLDEPAIAPPPKPRRRAKMAVKHLPKP